LNKNSKNFQTGFQDGNHIVELIMAEDDMVTACLTITGTHTGEYMSVPATGNKLEMTIIEICRFKNGKIIEAWIEFDSKVFDKVLTSQI
jgi:predicted ester cyclase